MTAKKASKKKDLEVPLQEATSLLEEKEKSRKTKKGESDYEFYRDSTTGFRKYKYKYQPCEKKVTNTGANSSFANASVELEGDLTLFFSITLCTQFV